MAIATPRGFQIRLPREYAFALLSRLSPFVAPFEVLQRVEAFHHIRGLLVYCGAFAAAVLSSKPIIVPLAMVFACIVAVEIQFSRHDPSWLLPVARLWSLASGYFVITIAVGLVVYSRVGTEALVLFFVGRLAAEIVFYAFDFWFTIRMRRRIGFGLAATERFFLHSYQSFARRFGITPSTRVSPSEIEADDWRRCLEQFRTEWPTVSRRFSGTPQTGNLPAVYSVVLAGGVPDEYEENF